VRQQHGRGVDVPQSGWSGEMEPDNAHGPMRAGARVRGQSQLRTALPKGSQVDRAHALLGHLPLRVSRHWARVRRHSLHGVTGPRAAVAGRRVGPPASHQRSREATSFGWAVRVA
jgi:hypothetical protein